MCKVCADSTVFLEKTMKLFLICSIYWSCLWGKTKEKVELDILAMFCISRRCSLSVWNTLRYLLSRTSSDMMEVCAREFWAKQRPSIDSWPEPQHHNSPPKLWWRRFRLAIDSRSDHDYPALLPRSIGLAPFYTAPRDPLTLILQCSQTSPMVGLDLRLSLPTWDEQSARG